MPRDAKPPVSSPPSALTSMTHGGSNRSAPHGIFSRYTIAKFRSFNEYARTSSFWRRTAIILLTPIPSLCTSLLPTFIPLQDPNEGVLKNWGYMVHFTITLGLVIFGSVFQIREPNAISRDIISNIDALWISLVGVLSLNAVVVLMGYLWRFPVPFIWIAAYPPYCVCLVLAHVVVLRHKLWGRGGVGVLLLKFAPTYILQSLQIVVYTSFSAVFQIASNWVRTVLVLLFPLLKLFFRHASQRLLSHLKDDAEEVAVSGVEICAVMYQSMIMQSVPSPYMTGILIGADVLQGLLAIRVFMDKKCVIPRQEIIEQASIVAASLDNSVKDEDLEQFATTIVVPQKASRLRMFSLLVHPMAHVEPSDSASRTNKSKKILTQSLEMVQAAESILLAEYFEVSVPMVNSVYFVVASQFDTAMCNPKVRPYYLDPSRLSPAIRSLALYTFLQALSVLLMDAVVWYRYRMSSTKLLAFVLERHGWSIQGKLITWLVMFFQLSVVHYGTCKKVLHFVAEYQLVVFWTGVDFSFRFEYSCRAPPQ